MTELDPRSASPADSAPDEGLSPRAAAEAKKAAAAKAAAAAFIQSAGDDYGNVEAAQPRDVKKGQRTAVIAGLIICVLVAAGVLTYLFASGFFNKQPVAEETQRVPLSDARVIAAFDEVAMDAPDISQYAYVSQDALIGPKFSDIVLNEPTNLGTPGNQIVTCEATATATFKNKGVEINVPVTLPFEYSNAGETWVPGDLVVGEATAVPLASANASDILGDADGDGATAYYDPAANTLTLDNAQLTSSGYGAVWAQEENFTLVLKGENQITGEGDFPHSAVYSHGAMTVKGNGSLTTSGTYFGLFGNNTITIEDGASVDLTVDFSSDEQDQPYAAVRAIGGLTVDGATLNAKNNATQDASFGTPGINTGLTAINGAKVNISSVNDHGICGDVIVSGAGTVVNASSASGEHYGIFAGKEDILGELGGDQKGIFTISDGAVVTASGGKGAMRWKPDLSGYTDPVVAAGDSAAAEEIIGDPAGTEYQNEKYVQVRSSLEPVEPTEPTDPTDPTTPTDPTEPTDPAKPEQQGKPSGQTESPQTGDSSDMALWIGLMLASCGGVLGMLLYRRKKAAAGK